jgi:hypothetical protein
MSDSLFVPVKESYILLRSVDPIDSKFSLSLANKEIKIDKIIPKFSYF